MPRRGKKYGEAVEVTTPTSSIKTELSDGTQGSYTETSTKDTNMLVLDSNKPKPSQLKISGPNKPRKLSKKQRKKLERVLDQKEKKAKRADLLNKLAMVQVDASELACMSSIAHLGTKNSNLQLSKRPLPEDLKLAVEKLNSIRGSKKRRKTEKETDDEVVNDSPDTSDISLSSDDEEKKETDVPDIIDAKPEDKKEEASKERNENDGSNDVDKEQSTVKKNQNPQPKLPALPMFPTVYVPLERDQEIQSHRLRLPILGEEQAIMEAIQHNHTVVLCGETGSGKTTQVPQFLYEAGYANQGMIGVTEPRRVAAISMSQRVASEMNLPSRKISYQIRYEGNVTADTAVKFMTDGVLLREVQTDFLLSKYSAIIIDEAHERSVYTDVLIGLLSRIVPLRNKKGKPMRLIIMSATLRVEDFTQNTRLFKVPPPVLRVDTRQHPVTVHFNKKTPIDCNGKPYLREAYKKICKVHRTLPAGGILVFVTGQNEVHALCKMLKCTFPAKPLSRNVDQRQCVLKTEESPSDTGNKESTPSLPKIDLDSVPSLPLEKELEHIEEKEDKDAPANWSDEDDLESDDDVMDDVDFSKEVDKTLPMHVLPLYSLLAPARQRDVFKPPPEDTRLCIIATNVAETSLTIPGIKYVVDTGKVKKRLYDKVTGISSFQITWVSKASADQRAGRSGRVGPGHAYRLYSSAVFQDFSDFSTPEIVSKPVPGLVLQMKQMNIERVVNFPFPTPPSLESLKAAEDLLITLGAVEKPQTRKGHQNKLDHYSGRITELGKAMALFPVHPRFGKMLATASAKEHIEILPYVIALVAALTVREVFVEQLQPPTSSEEKEQHRQLAARLSHLKSIWGGGTNEAAKLFGDLMVLLGAIGSAEYTGLTPGLCSQNCLRYKALMEIRKLRSQLINIINSVNNESSVCLNAKMEPPDNNQITLLRQVVLSAMGDHVARKTPESQIKKLDDAKDVRRLTGAYSCLLSTEPIFIHPTSIYFQNSKLPEYVVFQELIETNKLYMKGVTTIDPEWLSKLCPQYCSFSEPMEEPSPFLDNMTGQVKCHAKAAYGRLSWPLGDAVILYPPGLNRYKWFACFMLQECITKFLPRQFSLLLSKPEIMTRSWANLQPRTQSMLQALIEEEVDDQSKLLEAWRKNSAYLMEEFQQWLPESIREDLPPHWPPKVR